MLGPPVALGTVKSFEQLWEELSEKAATRPAGSGTVAELDAGVHFIGKKIVEEAAEVWMACEHESTDDAAMEMSQLLYHLQVMMIAKGYTLADVVHVKVILTDARYFQSFNKVFREFFGDNPPARICCVADLVVDCKVEVDVTCYNAARV